MRPGHRHLGAFILSFVGRRFVVASSVSSHSHCQRNTDSLQMVLPARDNDLRTCGLCKSDLDGLIVESAPTSYALSSEYDDDERRYGLTFEFDDGGMRTSPVPSARPHLDLTVSRHDTASRGTVAGLVARRPKFSRAGIPVSTQYCTDEHKASKSATTG